MTRRPATLELAAPVDLSAGLINTGLINAGLINAGLINDRAE